MARMKKKKQPTQYERVQQILNDAQGSTIPSYDGYRDFWNLPLDEFTEVVIVGQRMIDDPQESDQADDTDAAGGCSSCGSTNGTHLPNCWPTTSSGSSSTQTGGQKLSTRSGLIIGLRGEYPFDGSVFPKLLWHAKNEVIESDIQVIADWIDSGCPTEDSSSAADDNASGTADDSSSTATHAACTASSSPATVTLSVRTPDHVALTNGEKAHAPSTKPTSTITDSTQSLRQRKCIDSMTEDELSRLRKAIWCMNQYNDYWLDERSWNYWGRIHADACQHGWEQFVTWHRAYLYYFEQQLRDYDNSITVPYWDYTHYDKANRNTMNTKTLDIGVIPQAFRCWIDDKGIAKLKEQQGLLSDQEIAGLEKIQFDPSAADADKQTYNSGSRFLTAAGIDYTLESFTNDIGQQDYRYSTKTKAIYEVLKDTNSLWHRNRWPGTTGTASHYPTTRDINSILTTQGFSPFGGGPTDDHYGGALEYMHGRIHSFGGGMNPQWQAYSDGNDQSADNPQYGDLTDNRVSAYDPLFWGHHSNIDRLWLQWQQQNPNQNPEGLTDVLAPWSMTVNDTLSVTKFGYEYIKDSHHVPTIPHYGYKRLQSTSLGVRPHVLSDFNTAQVRLHRVQKAKRNGIFRLFLNLPDADENTPIENNVHYAGQIATFGGNCVGGPNHCDVPFPRRIRFDHRPLHHNEPRNHRLDVTDTVKRLRDEQNATDISLHLVVIGIDGKLNDEALYFDGISLNFMD